MCLKLDITVCDIKFETNTHALSVIQDDCILGFTHIENKLVLWNVKTGDYSAMDQDFDKVDFENLDVGSWQGAEYNLFGNGVIAIPLIGADGNHYVGLYDYNFNRVCDPLKGFLPDTTEVKDNLENNRIVIITGGLGYVDNQGSEIKIYSVCDLNGVEKFTFTGDPNTYFEKKFSDGIIQGAEYMDGHYYPHYYDVGGNILPINLEN